MSRSLTIPSVLPPGPLALPALVVAVVLAVASGLALARSDGDELPDDAAFRVEGDIVTEQELQERVDTLGALYGVVAPTEPGQLAAFRRDAAKSLAVSLLLEEEADARDVQISAKQAQAELATIISDRLGGDRAQFEKYLGTAGVSERQVLDEITRTLATSRVFAEVVADVDGATTRDAREEYDARRDEMTTPERRRVANIVVETEADARQVVAQLGAGRSFAQVARASSLDASTSASGGDLGLRAATELEPGYADAAFGAEQGAVFGPVRTQHGWNVGTVLRIVPGDPLAFDDVGDTLVRAITARRQLDAWRAWLGDLLEDADVEYAAEFEPDDPTSPPSGVQPGADVPAE